MQNKVGTLQHYNKPCNEESLSSTLENHCDLTQFAAASRNATWKEEMCSRRLCHRDRKTIEISSVVMCLRVSAYFGQKRMLKTVRTKDAKLCVCEGMGESRYHRHGDTHILRFVLDFEWTLDILRLPCRVDVLCIYILSRWWYLFPGDLATKPGGYWRLRTGTLAVLYLYSLFLWGRWNWGVSQWWMRDWCGEISRRWQGKMNDSRSTLTV